MEVPIWYVVALYLLGVLITLSFMVDRYNRSFPGLFTACAFWPVISAVALVVGIFKSLLR